MFTQPLKLHCGVQKYHWGKVGEESLVGRLAQQTESTTPYAELWVGAHPSLSAQIEVDGTLQLLSELIAENPLPLVGSDVVGRFGPRLPFLFKILSVGSCLSIQAHPDKALAERLHVERGYPDDNHKPEMAIALSSLSLLYGFRTFEEIAKNLDRVPEFKIVVDDGTCALVKNARSTDEQRAALELVYRQLMFADPEELAQVAASFRDRFSREELTDVADPWVRDLVQEAYQDGDVGLLCFYLMNVISLKPGQAVFIGPNVPHAYLQGDLAECMANSDNVVRAGLTPKERDVDTLLEMVIYEPSESPLLTPRLESNGFSWEHYTLPTDEFRISVLRADDIELSLESADSPEVLFCLEGQGTLGSDEESAALELGSAFFVPAECGRYRLEAKDLVLFRVTVPEK